MNSKQIILEKSKSIREKGQELQESLEQKRREVEKLQAEIQEINQTLNIYEGAYAAYMEVVKLLDDEEQNKPEIEQQ